MVPCRCQHDSGAVSQNGTDGAAREFAAGPTEAKAVYRTPRYSPGREEVPHDQIGVVSNDFHAGPAPSQPHDDSKHREWRKCDQGLTQRRHDGEDQDDAAADAEVGSEQNSESTIQVQHQIVAHQRHSSTSAQSDDRPWPSRFTVHLAGFQVRSW